MKKKIIAFYASMHGAGKTTAAEAVRDIFHSWAWSFSDPLKEMFHGAFNDWYDSVPKDEPYREFPFTLRDCFIKIGQGMKELDPDIWIKLLKAKIEDEDIQQALYTIDDLRFPNEYRALRDWGAKLIKIERPELTAVKGETEGLLSGYEFDAVVVNNGSLVEFQNRVVDVVWNLARQGGWF